MYIYSLHTLYVTHKCNCEFIQIYLVYLRQHLLYFFAFFVKWHFNFILYRRLVATRYFVNHRVAPAWRRYFFADCSRHGCDSRRKYQRERDARDVQEVSALSNARKTYSTAAEHSRDEARSNADLITGQTSRESRPGRDFISSAVGEMR